MEEVKGEGARKEHGSLPSGRIPSVSSFSLLNVTSLVAYVIYRFAIFVQKLLRVRVPRLKNLQVSQPFIDRRRRRRRNSSFERARGRLGHV